MMTNVRLIKFPQIFISLSICSTADNVCRPPLKKDSSSARCSPDTSRSLWLDACVGIKIFANFTRNWNSANVNPPRKVARKTISTTVCVWWYYRAASGERGRKMINFIIFTHRHNGGWWRASHIAKKTLTFDVEVASVDVFFALLGGFRVPRTVLTLEGRVFGLMRWQKVRPNLMTAQQDSRRGGRFLSSGKRYCFVQVGVIYCRVLWWWNEFFLGKITFKLWK